MTVRRGEGEPPATPMTELDIMPFEGSEAERRVKAERVQAYREAEMERQAKSDKKKLREIRLRRVDDHRRVGAGMVLPTAEREGHDEVVVEDRTILDEKTGGMVRARGPRVVTQTPLDRYFRRKSIDDRQFKAGEKLRRDWFVSGIEPHVVANLMGSGGGGECSYGMAKSELQASAREEWRLGVQAVGIRLSPILIAVCCEDRTAADWLLSIGYREKRGKEQTGQLESSEKADWRVHFEAMVRLKLALDVLADHYDRHGWD